MSSEHYMQKGERLRICIGRSEYKGTEYFDIRQYAKSKDGKDFVPTPSGVNVPLALESLIELKEVFNTSIDEQIELLSVEAKPKRKAKLATAKATSRTKVEFIAKTRIDGAIVRSESFETLALLFAAPISKLFNITRAEARELNVGYYQVTTSPDGGSISERMKANKNTGYTPKY